MKALLIYPEMPDTFWNMKLLARLTGRRSDYPPLGLITLAAMLPDDWHIRILDLNDKQLDNSYLDWADTIFISAMSVQADSAKRLIEQCSATRKPIIAGGPLFAHEHSKFPKVDHFILNEAELTLPEFLKDLQAGTARRIYSSPHFAEIRNSPVPRYDLIDLNRYTYGIIQYSRGCPFQCDFCDVTQLYGHTTRTKTGDQIIRELSAMGNPNKLDLILFADDNLIGNRKELKEDLLPALIQWRAKNKISVPFATQVSINLGNDQELMTLMLEAGFRHIFVGIETPEAQSLQASRKTQNLKSNLMQSIQVLHKNGFIVTGGFIVGFDTDKPDIFNRMVEFVQQSGVVISTLNILKAPEGTLLSERMKKENRWITTTDFDEQKINFIPAMPIDDLYKGYKKMIDAVYLPDGVTHRIVNFFSNYRGAQVVNKLNSSFKGRDMITFLRILFKLGILDKHRKHFWDLLRWGIQNQPKQLDLIFLFIVLSAHFRHQHHRFIQNLESKEFVDHLDRIRQMQPVSDIPGRKESFSNRIAEPS